MDIVKLTINRLAWLRANLVPTKPDGFYHTVLTGRDGLMEYDKILKSIESHHPDLYPRKTMERDGSWFTISGMKFIWRAK